VAGLPTEPRCSLVLHRPLIPDAAKEQLALQQSAAATALLRLNAADKVWPLFQDQPDPRLRSYLLHRLANYSPDPRSLITQLATESNVTRRSSLILGLGEFAKAKLLSADQQASVTADVAKRYADDPDSGVHGAAEWALKQLEAEDKIAGIPISDQLIVVREENIDRIAGRITCWQHLFCRCRDRDRGQHLSDFQAVNSDRFF